MPAYRERVHIYPAQKGMPGRTYDFPAWWRRDAFFEKFGARQVDTGNPAYVDYGMLLAPAEAIEWDRQCREAFAPDPRSREAATVKAMRDWELILQTAGWVIVESYEWESGLD